MESYLGRLYSPFLQRAIVAGKVRIDKEQAVAVIVAPPHPEALTDDDWLSILRAASEMRRELESLGFIVIG